MARFASLLLASTLTPTLDTNVYNISRPVVLPATGVSNGDYVPLVTVPRNGRIIGADLSVGATLGAGATIQLALYRGGVLVRNLTGATTAATASYANSNALGPIDALMGDEIVLVVGGANITAAATATADVQLQH